ncbi:GntR family transcriptional regulator [Hydrogenophaga sp.]|uniref:GntR family transcriptional regulator n=1 Tax=Hydrogenophaga sp. TaxID=1904254 RepID=UPI002715F4CC|nr:GntR family transcriptional regulator [Hydrogenophaga sp.]MDO9435372.1 GntR family transcriptional regulator [Hydrogenophaga sp.]
MDLNLDRTPGLTAQVASRLSEAIVNGDLVAGERLIEIDLAARLGVSRAPLREALRELSGTGLVIHRAHKGAFVANPSPDEVAEMSIFRGVLEGMAARVVAAERKPQVMERLETLCADLEAAAARADKARFAQLHWDFHRSICEQAGNRFLLQAWDGVSRLIRLYFNMALLSVEMTSTLRNDRAYLLALRSGTPDHAEALLRSQIIGIAFNVLDKPLPNAVREYVTLRLDDDGSVQTVKDGQASWRMNSI